MECKTVPKVRESKIDIETTIQSADRPTWKSCSRFGFKLCIGILLLVVLVYCIYLHYSLKQVTDQLNHQEEIKTPDPGRLMQKRRYDQRQRRNQRRHQRRNQPPNRIYPAVQLTGWPTGDRQHELVTSGSDGCSYSSPCFTWYDDDNSYYKRRERENEDYSLTKTNGKAIGIKITKKGLYDIHTQLCVAGLKENRLPIENQKKKKFELWNQKVSMENKKRIPWIGLELIKVRSGTEEILATAYKTQDQRGRSYPGSNGAGIGPVDSISLGGMFVLNCNDVIKIRLSDQTDYGKINFVQDAARSLFGLKMIRQLNMNC